MTEEEQGPQEGCEDTRSNVMEGFPDRVGDCVGSRGGGGLTLCQSSGDLCCTECGAVCEGAEDGGEGSGGLRRKEVMESGVVNLGGGGSVGKGGKARRESS